MNFLLVGYGKMGKAIEAIALERGNQVIQAVHDHSEVNCDLASIDAVIEFSAPEVAFENIKFGMVNDIPVISGTTGWLDRMPEVEQLVKEKDGAFFYASNFSLGVNLFFRLNKQLAALMNKYNYRPEIEEIHHTHKLDAPSGTAITLAEGILENQENLAKWVNKESDKDDELPIISVREAEVPGTHIITYKGEHDEISIAHKAHSRQGFALGAVMVAEWIVDKKGVLSMDDFLRG
jgi:4-hydroxy-tetrahydrodipicolinate reductase